ncbi:putative cullin-associated nedd8-dissociated protein 1, partial [Pavlovales sp. CCMP2436]
GNMSLALILDKMSSRDKDFRYMATSDLLGELQKDTFKMDNESERKLCHMIITLLSDAAGDVQGLAVKCLPLLVRKVQTSNVEEIVDKLFQMVKAGKEEERDISTIG